MLTESAANARAARKKAGLTQQQSADLIGVHIRSWQRWESGEHEMSPGLLEMFLFLSKEQAIRPEPAADIDRETE
ncbi:helix-turn-helix domain-containing protein [Acetobacter fabarum]|uniref:HTH cro/C1-type domain-containing protein n=1 Tax=Acetobacter fabarum TaxID=483199 RepID=A0A269XV29_9PROT|nr:helix-turn-helix domain-containing protein [Acetobacter fabarum]PAK77167.1 hypothetical protein B8X00_11415 [Acetobacter fabarum]PEN22947.1 XRE family transcriptional regulator [Acetobacter fabarum]